MRFIIFFIILSFVLTGNNTKSYAVDYTVRNLAVDVEAETAIKAREEALAQARSNAFDVLKKRLPGMLSEVQTPDAATIATMVDSFEINREKLSKNRYLASVNVTFNERAVQTYLGRTMNYAGFGGVGKNDDFIRVLGEFAAEPQQNNNGYFQNRQDRARQNVSLPSTMSVISVPISGVRQWISIKKSLETIYNVQDIAIKEISARRAVVNVKHNGTIYDLQNALMGRGMRLYANTDSSRADVPYILVTRG